MKNIEEVPMIVQSELNKELLLSSYRSLERMRRMDIMGSHVELASYEKVEAYAEQIFDLSKGELISLDPIFTMTPHNQAEAGRLRTFPALGGSFLNWPVKEGATGVTVVIGPTGARKSEFLVSAFQPDIFLRFAEPQEQFDQLPNVLQVADMEELLSLLFVFASQRIPVAVDSLRKAAFELTGAAGSKGIIARLYTAVTDLNNFVSYLGMNVPVVLNPNTSDKDALREVFSNMAGAASGALLLQDGVVVESLFRRRESRSGLGANDFIGKNGSVVPSDVADKVRKGTDTATLASSEVELYGAPQGIESSNADALDNGAAGYDDSSRSGTIIDLQ